MTKASGTALRVAAARIADERLARRAAQLREREEQLRHFATDYHYANAQARKTRTDAQAHAAKITADAEARIAALHDRADKQASVIEDEARATVRAILELGERRETVMDLTGLSAAQVRSIERTATPAPGAARRHTRHSNPPSTTAS